MSKLNKNSRDNIKKVLITDLDNTLYDWVSVWHASFSALIKETSEISGVDIETLFDEAQKVHKKHGTSEYIFLIQELEILKRIHSDISISEILKLYQPAILAYEKARDSELRLFLSVYETLKSLKKRGVLIVGHTESLAYYTDYRLRFLKLDGVLDVLYSSPDHDFPEDVSIEALKRYKYKDQGYKLEKTLHHHTPKGALKPDKEMLISILASLNADCEDCMYVGDSLHKDIKMANDVGIASVLAEYGQSDKQDGYDLLKRVTHWTEEQVQKEKNLTRDEVIPDFIIKNKFSDLLELFEFGEY